MLRNDRRKCILFTNDLTLYSFFVPGLNRLGFKRFQDVFRENLFISLISDGFSQAQVEKVLSEWKRKKYWVFSPVKNSKTKPSEFDKISIQNYFQPLVESFKSQYIKENPNKIFNYLIDIYSKWYQNYFYLCEKFKSEHPNRLTDEFEVKFIRLKYRAKIRLPSSLLVWKAKW